MLSETIPSKRRPLLHISSVTGGDVSKLHVAAQTCMKFNAHSPARVVWIVEISADIKKIFADTDTINIRGYKNKISLPEMKTPAN